MSAMHSDSIWLENVVYYDSSGSEASAFNDCLCSHSDSYTDTSSEGSDDEEIEHTNILNAENDAMHLELECIYGRNKYKWFKETPTQEVKPKPNNLDPSSNLTENNVDFMFIWKKLIDENILQDILRWTNAALMKSYAAATEGKEELLELDMTELIGFIGVLVLSALFRSNIEGADCLYPIDGWGIDLYKCVMSKERFVNLLKCVRFDDPSKKEKRQSNSKLAAISKIFHTFVNNCQNLYNPGHYVTVDKVRIPFKDPPCLTHHMRRCDKVGFEITCMCDAKTGYFYNGFINNTTDSRDLIEDEKKCSVHTRSVLRATRPLFGTGRNVTKCFTSVELIDALKKRGLSCVGTVKKSMRELPPSFLPSKQREKGSTLYAFTKQITLVSHVPRRNQAYIVASSMHHNDDKCEIIPCFEKTMRAVFKIDKRRDKFSCSRHTRRGSLAIFYWILDISLINTLIAYEVHSGVKVKRWDFMEKMAFSLVDAQMRRRVCDNRLPFELREKIMGLLSRNDNGTSDCDDDDDNEVWTSRRT